MADENLLKAEERDLNNDTADRLAMRNALKFTRERSRRAQDELLHLIEQTEQFLEFHGESPAEADHHWRVIANLNELHVLLARLELKALHALPPDLDEERAATPARSPTQDSPPHVLVDADTCVHHFDAFMTLAKLGLYIGLTKEGALQWVLMSADEYRRLPNT